MVLNSSNKIEYELKLLFSALVPNKLKQFSLEKNFNSQPLVAALHNNPQLIYNPKYKHSDIYKYKNEHYYTFRGGYQK